jgi:hypothetical protein
MRISKKYGVNPAIPHCFFCGEPKNELLLLGYLKDDMEAPKNLVIDYVPCDACKAKMDKGITIICVSPTPLHKDQQPLIPGYYPRPKYVVVSEDNFKKAVNDPKILESGLKARRMLMLEEEFNESFPL